MTWQVVSVIKKHFRDNWSEPIHYNFKHDLNLEIQLTTQDYFPFLLNFSLLKCQQVGRRGLLRRRPFLNSRETYAYLYMPMEAVNLPTKRNCIGSCSSVAILNVLGMVPMNTASLLWTGHAYSILVPVRGRRLNAVGWNFWDPKKYFISPLSQL